MAVSQHFSGHIPNLVVILRLVFRNACREVSPTQRALRLSLKPFKSAIFVEVVLLVTFIDCNHVNGCEVNQTNGTVWHITILVCIAIIFTGNQTLTIFLEEQFL